MSTVIVKNTVSVVVKTLAQSTRIAQGTTSLTPPAGVAGPTGPAGGFSYSGEGVPSDTLGVDEDTYLNILNGDTYQKDGSSWGTAVGSIVGPQGDVGVQAVSSVNTQTEDVVIDQASVEAQTTLRTAKGDEAYSILSTDRCVALTASLTSPRIWTLPAASTYKAGRRLLIRDEVGGIGSTNTLAIQRSGTDTIDGATTLTLDSPWEGAEFESNGVNAWGVIAVSGGATKARRRIMLGFDDTSAAPAVGDCFGWNGAIWVPKKVREMLTGARTYYVNPGGSDSNDGLSSGEALGTIQKSFDKLLGLDTDIYNVTIQLEDGTYTSGGNIPGPWVGSGSLTVQGNASTPSNVLVSTTSANCFSLTGVLPSIMTIKDVKLQTTTSGMCIANTGSGEINFRTVDFGACAQYHLYASLPAAIIRAKAGYSISGGATRHLDARFGGLLDTGGRTVDILNNVGFSQFIQGFIIGTVVANGMVFNYNGYTVTGTKYVISLNSVLYGSGSTFPGDVGGSNSTGGQVA